MPKLITKAEMIRLLRNGASPEGHKPVIKLFGGSSCTWLISEIDPTNPDIAFGLADMGSGTPELGYISISELEKVRFQFGVRVERDRYFTATKTLVEYAEAARAAGRIVT